jgi:DNA-binding response OmpR family regulator
MRVLIIEDEIELGNSIQSYLNDDNLICDIAIDAQMAIEMQETQLYSCIILDVMLPNQSGISYLTQLSSQQTKSKIIVISAKNSNTDRVKALNLGAIAYLVKPFHLASLKAVVQQIVHTEDMVYYPPYQINLQQQEVLFQNQIIPLSKTEIELLHFLILNRNQVVSKNALAEHLNQNSALYFDNFKAIDYSMENLIKKLPLLAQQIQLIHHIAYKLT